MSTLCVNHTCPGRLIDVTGDYTLETQGRVFVVPQVPRQKCVVCETELLNADACDQIDRELLRQGWQPRKGRSRLHESVAPETLPTNEARGF